MIRTLPQTPSKHHRQPKGKAMKRSMLGTLVWALFSWRGRIKRMPYAVCFLILALLTRPLMTMAAQTMAVYVLPPPEGTVLDFAYVTSLTLRPEIIPVLLPFCYMYIVLDIKRLRSIGAPLILAFIFSGLSPFVPLIAPDFAEMAAMTAFAYHAILAVIPAKEDRMSPLERKYRTWQSIATGDGTPRRLSGKDITSWRVVPKPKKKQ